MTDDPVVLLHARALLVHRWLPGAVAPDMGDEVPGYAGLARKP